MPALQQTMQTLMVVWEVCNRMVYMAVRLITYPRTSGNMQDPRSGLHSFEKSLAPPACLFESSLVYRGSWKPDLRKLCSCLLPNGAFCFWVLASPCSMVTGALAEKWEALRRVRNRFARGRPWIRFPPPPLMMMTRSLRMT